MNGKAHPSHSIFRTATLLDSCEYRHASHTQRLSSLNATAATTGTDTGLQLSTAAHFPTTALNANTFGDQHPGRSLPCSRPTRPTVELPTTTSPIEISVPNANGIQDDQPSRPSTSPTTATTEFSFSYNYTPSVVDSGARLSNDYTSDSERSEHDIHLDTPSRADLWTFEPQDFVPAKRLDEAEMNGQYSWQKDQYYSPPLPLPDHQNVAGGQAFGLLPTHSHAHAHAQAQGQTQIQSNDQRMQGQRQTPPQPQQSQPQSQPQHQSQHQYLYPPFNHQTFNPYGYTPHLTQPPGGPSWTMNPSRSNPYDSSGQSLSECVSSIGIDIQLTMQCPLTHTCRPTHPPRQSPHLFMRDSASTLFT